jgi:hypothetical protein
MVKNKKTSRPQIMGREGVLAVPPKFIALSVVEGADALCADIHRLPSNAGSAVQTICRIGLILSCVHLNGSRGNFNWILTSAISTTTLHISGGFCQFTFLCHSLYLINAIICGIERMSRCAPDFVQAHAKEDKSQRCCNEIENPVGLPL